MMASCIASFVISFLFICYLSSSTIARADDAHGVSTPNIFAIVGATSTMLTVRVTRLGARPAPEMMSGTLRS